MFTACTTRGEVTFEFFNLYQDEIWVTRIQGLPANATPGRLIPVHQETTLEVKSYTLTEPVTITPKIKILWKENGKTGWPGGLKPGETVPSGVTHAVEFQRSDLGIPAKLNSGNIRFTYLGNDKWRVKLLKAN